MGGSFEQVASAVDIGVFVERPLAPDAGQAGTVIDGRDVVAGLGDGSSVLNVAGEPGDVVESQAARFAAAEDSDRFPLCHELLDKVATQKASTTCDQIAHARLLISDGSCQVMNNRVVSGRLAASDAVGGPFCELFAVDFYIMSNIDREVVMEEQERDRVGECRAGGRLLEFLSELCARFVVSMAFDDDGRFLVGWLSESDQCTSANVGVLVEDGFARDAEECLGFGLDTVCLPAAEPKTADVVEVADVPHAVPGGILIANLGGSGVRIASEVAGRHRGAADKDFADLAVIQDGQVLKVEDRFVVNFDDADIDFGEQCADTGAFALCRAGGGVFQDIVSADDCDGECFGGSIGCVDVGRVAGECVADRLDHIGRNGCPGREDTSEAWQGDVVFSAVAADPVPECRRTERLCDLLCSDRCNDPTRIDGSGSCGVDVGEDSGDTHGDIEEGKQRKAGQVAFFGPDPETCLEQVGLGTEHSVFVFHTLGRSGAAAGEDDGGGVVGFDLRGE